MIEYLQTNDDKYRDALIALYIGCFSSGISAQYIDEVQLSRYVDLILNKGYGVLAIENELLVAALLCFPLKYDKDVPIEITDNYNVDNCIYIAELMVTEQKRGFGIAKKMMEEFENKLDTNVTDLFIRVWDKNVPALTLYEKQGFTSVATILQHKLEKDGANLLLMRKMYLNKKAGISYAEINHKNY